MKRPDKVIEAQGVEITLCGKADRVLWLISGKVGLVIGENIYLAIKRNDVESFLDSYQKIINAAADFNKVVLVLEKK